MPAWNPSHAPARAPQVEAQRPIVLPRPAGRAGPRRGRRRARPARRSRGRRGRTSSSGTSGNASCATTSAGEPPAEPEHDRVQRAQQDARRAAEAAAPAHAAPHQQEREEHEDRQADHRACEALAEGRLRHVRREVDLRRRVERGVDSAAVEERVQEPRARLRLVRPEGAGMAELREHDLVAVAEVRQQLLRRELRRRREVERAADEERLDVRVLHARVLAGVRSRRERVRSGRRRRRGTRFRRCPGSSPCGAGPWRSSGRRPRCPPG